MKTKTFSYSFAFIFRIATHCFMFSAEITYKLNLLRRNVIKIIHRSITFLFFLTSLATIGLMAYEFGYSVTAAGRIFISHSYNLIMHIFLIGSVTNIALNPKIIWQEKGFWIEVIVLVLLLFVILTQNPRHFPSEKWLHHTDHILMHILLLFISIIQLSKSIVTTLQRRIRPEMMFTYSFLTLIFLGAALLMLPKAHYGSLTFIDALFTSTSAVCITGLITIDTATTFTMTGQLILLLLIQIGGIGVMTFTSFIALSFFTQTSFIDQMALKNILSEESMNNIFRTLMYTLFTTIIVEAIGSWLLWLEIRDVPEHIIPNPTFFSIFHAVSAFCNAGFSTLGENLASPAVRSLYGFQCWIAVLIILGGIGFPIVFNYGKLINHKIRNLFYRLSGSSKRMPSHVRIVNTTTRIVITTTLFLLAGGTLLFFLFEQHHLLQDLPWRGKLAVSFLGAVTPRTAGFNNVAMDLLSSPTIALTMLLMWIGASPLSTGGGIKTTTFTIIVKNIFSILKGKKNIEIFKRQLPPENVKRAHAIAILSILWIGLATLLLTVLVPGSSISNALFEVISALSTVGLSLNFTPHLTTAGKILIILTMFVGRVGLITLLTGIFSQQSSQNYTYAEDNVIL